MTTPKYLAFYGQLIGLTLVLTAIILFALGQPKLAKADNFVGDYSTTTDSTFASATVTRQLKNGSSSVLGNVVFTATSSLTTYPQIIIYDASSTMATTTAKVLARFGAANQQLGTYQFNSAASYGIKMEVAPGYSGNATVTWR